MLEIYSFWRILEKQLYIYLFIYIILYIFIINTLSIKFCKSTCFFALLYFLFSKQKYFYFVNMYTTHDNIFIEELSIFKP